MWRDYKISELGEIVTGITPSTKERSFWGGDIQFVTPADMDGSRYVQATERYVTAKGARIGRLLSKDSVLVTCIGSVGKMALASQPCVTNQQINAIVCNPEHDPKCIYFALSFAMERLKHMAGVNVIPIINKSDFGKLKINLPPLEEQAIIARILDAMDITVERTREAVRQAQGVRKSLLGDLLSHGIGQ